MEQEINPVINMIVFAAFVAVTLFIVFRVSRRKATENEFYAAGRSFTGRQNGIAIAGDYLSAASFLGICGAIAVAGYDGFLSLEYEGSEDCLTGIARGLANVKRILEELQ